MSCNDQGTEFEITVFNPCQRSGSAQVISGLLPEIGSNPCLSGQAGITGSFFVSYFVHTPILTGEKQKREIPNIRNIPK